MIVSASVVHAIGEPIWKNGLPRTLRGAGMPVRPPAVCVKRTHPSPTSGSDWIVSRATAGTLTSFGPSFMRVTPMWPPPSWP